MTSSKEDKILFEVILQISFFFFSLWRQDFHGVVSCNLYSQKELQDLEEEQSKNVRGFREVIDLISASQKPVVAHNTLDGVYLYGLFCLMCFHL